MENVTRITFENREINELSDSSGKELILRLDQKSVEGMMDRMSKSQNAGELELHTGAGTLTTTITWLQLQGQ